MTNEIKRILILAANPIATVQLRLAEEARDIREGLERSRSRDAFSIEYSSATRSKDIRRKMLDYKPHIVHFCGHGDGEQGIVFEDDSGNAVHISAGVLAEFFELFKSTVECVVLNACYTEMQAYEISKHIKYVIGMNESLEDKIAIAFSVAFYDAVYAINPYEYAYRVACNAIQWVDATQRLTPVLKKQKNLSPIENDMDSEYIAALKFIDSGRVSEGINGLQAAHTKGHLRATLMLSMLYREGIGVETDTDESELYLEMAQLLPDAEPATWADLGYRIYDKHHPSLESAALLTAALECGHSIPGQTCVGAVRIFYRFSYMDSVLRYARYGANQLQDEKCKRIYDKLLSENRI